MTAVRCLFIAIVTVLFTSTSAQYYLNNYGPPQPLMSNNNNPYEIESNLVDKKYVNSGQSVMLICDLPNSMPDGKVSGTFLVYA
jgi:hypothetical protein